MPGTALFDLDKTITTHGTWSRFVRQATGGGVTFWSRLPAAGAQAVRYKFGGASRASVKEKAIALYLAGRSRHEMEALANTFVTRELDTGLRPGAVATIEAHKAAGDRLIIASAAVDLIVEPLGRALGFTDFICTHLAWDKQDRLLPTLDGENCYGAEKLRRVEAFFADRPASGPTYFYSDHITDLPSLLWADKGVAVNPSMKLRRAARPNDLPIVDWTEASPALAQTS